MEYTLGGNRIGSGKKMQGSMHNYFRSTHNLSEKFISSMASGALYPCLCKLATRGDSFDISIAADCRTIPTMGPLFGSYKMQVDVYQVPVRLYQGILHNNPLAIGLKMNQVYFPEIQIGSYYSKSKDRGVKMNNSSLLKYLGLSGLGRRSNEDSEDYQYIYRRINAIPILAYYDIFKNYYANKQEEYAYVISNATEPFYGKITSAKWQVPASGTSGEFKNDTAFITGSAEDGTYAIIEIFGEQLVPDNIYIEIAGYNETGTAIGDDSNTLRGYMQSGKVGLLYSTSKHLTFLTKLSSIIVGNAISYKVSIEIEENQELSAKNSLTLNKFELDNIDKMRYDLLSNNQLGTRFIIGGTGAGAQTAYMPYSVLTDLYDDPITDNEGTTLNALPLNGLVLKTYQNDIFNNWLNSEWIEGENGINELSKVSVTDGAFSMDALSFAEKLYNMLNRIAVAGATYEDWQDAVYEQVKRRQIESPIFCGGLSQEVVFDEIVQTAPAGDGVLGTLGGRGRLSDQSKKGGKIHIKCDEACFIIAIASLTPRQVYSQGNEFYLTDIKTMDDLHKPAMDGIGFQDLIGERMAWWDTAIPMQSGLAGSPVRSKVGKLPAWIEYMTSVDKAYGDFAEEYGAGYMVLNRNYEQDPVTKGIKDATTYVDPQKYNYAFAYSALDAQNFWVQINFDIKARRLMSARLIPNV